MTDKERAIRFYNENGFYIVTSPGQQELANEMVKEGLLQLAKPEWFRDNYKPDNIYVHASVDCRMKMPCGLVKRVFNEPEFYIGEYVMVQVTIEEGWMPSHGLGKITARVANGNYEVSFIGGSCSIVPPNKISRTFSHDERA